MAIVFLRSILALLAVIQTGCTYGILYTSITTPLVRNMRNTPFSPEGVTGQSYLVKEPVSGVGVQVEWASHAIGDIAAFHKLRTIHYADLHTLSILGGLYRKQTVTVYGERDAKYSVHKTWACQDFANARGFAPLDPPHCSLQCAKSAPHEN